MCNVNEKIHIFEIKDIYSSTEHLERKFIHPQEKKAL